MTADGSSADSTLIKTDRRERMRTAPKRRRADGVLHPADSREHLPPSPLCQCVPRSFNLPAGGGIFRCVDEPVTSACCLRPVPHRVCAVAEPFVELKGLRVTLDKLVYQPAMQTPPDRPHCFVYFITIHNDSPHTVTIKGRKWVVRNDRGRITAHMGRLVNATSDHSHI